LTSNNKLIYFNILWKYLYSLTLIFVVFTKFSDPWVLEFVVSNPTGNSRLENCISLDFHFHGMSDNNLFMWNVILLFGWSSTIFVCTAWKYKDCQLMHSVWLMGGLLHVPYMNMCNSKLVYYLCVGICRLEIWYSDHDRQQLLLTLWGKTV
jgi:hypothetical protein